MDRLESRNHSKWECNVFIPKRRRKILFGILWKYVGEVFHRLASQRESRIE